MGMVPTHDVRSTASRYSSCSTPTQRSTRLDRKQKKEYVVPKCRPAVSSSCCCCWWWFSHSARWLPARKKLLYTVANPARGLLNREQYMNSLTGLSLSPSCPRLKINLNASRPSEHPPVRGKMSTRLLGGSAAKTKPLRGI